MPPEIEPKFQVGDIFRVHVTFGTTKGIILSVKRLGVGHLRYYYRHLAGYKPYLEYFDHNSRMGINAILVKRSKVGKILYGK